MPTNTLEIIHEQHRQQQKHGHETRQSAQAAKHSRHAQELKDLHGKHQMELKQLHQKHALQHEQTTGHYETMPADHVSQLAQFMGQNQQKEIDGLNARHGAEENMLHNAHFNEHLREHVARNNSRR